MMRNSVLIIFLMLSSGVTAIGQRQTEAGTVLGQVTMKDGTPIADAVIVIEAFNALRKSVRTDKQGNYEIKGLSPGTYLASAFSAKHTLAVEEKVIAGVAKEVRVLSGVQVRLDFTMIPGGVLTGKLVDANGQPVAGEMVFIEREEPGGLSSTPITFDTATDDEGHFRFYGLPPGKYTAVAARGISLQRSTPFLRTFYPGVATRDTASRIEISSGQEIALGSMTLLNLKSGFSVLGRFVDLERNSPVSNLPFKVTGITSEQEPVQTNLRSQADGSFAVSFLPSGNYQISPQVEEGIMGSLTFAAQRFSISEKDVSGLLIRVESGLAVQGRISIQGRGAATNRDCTLVIKEGTDAADGTRPIFPIKLNADGTFQATGLRSNTKYLFAVLPRAGNLRIGSVSTGGRVLYQGNGPLSLFFVVDLSRTELRSLEIELISARD